LVGKPPMNLRAVLLAAAWTTVLLGSARASDVEDWINDCKGEPGPETLADCNRAIGSGQLDTPLLLRLLPDRAESFVHEKQFKSAIADSDRALALAPGDPDAMFVRARALGDTRRTAEALAAFDRLIALKPGIYFFYESRAIAAADGHRYDVALADFDHALALAPGMPKPFLERAYLLLTMSRFDLAVAAFGEAITRWPQNPNFCTARGLAYLQWKGGPPDRLALARSDFDSALSLAPDNVDVLLLRAEVETQQGDAAAAAVDRRRANRVGPVPPK